MKPDNNEAQPATLQSPYLSFPEVRAKIPWSLPVEITLIGTLGKGEGDAFIQNAAKRQKAHPTFVDDSRSSSAKIGNTNLSKEDVTAVYSFFVGKKDLVFHRHAGHRVIMGITGSAGAYLKFSSCTAKEAQETPEKFLEKIFVVFVPGDSVFVLRFSGEVYHQFGPGDTSKNGFFAISVNTNEIQGLSGELLATEPIPPQVAELLEISGIPKNVVYLV